MLVKVLSKQMFDSTLNRMGINDLNVEKHLDKAFISIINDDGKDTSFFEKEHPNVIKFIFDDATDEENKLRIKKGLVELKLFSNEDALRLINFLENNKRVSILLVHCAAGQSRSGAIGTFANDLYGEERYHEFMRSNPMVRPNYFILSLIKRVYYEFR